MFQFRNLFKIIKKIDINLKENKIKWRKFRVIIKSKIALN